MSGDPFIRAPGVVDADDSRVLFERIIEQFRGPQILVQSEQHTRKKMICVTALRQILGKAPDPFSMHLVSAAVTKADEPALLCAEHPRHELRRGPTGCVVVDPDEKVVLVANPRSRRSQDQLHIHIMRLLPDAGERLSKLKPVYIKKLAGSPDPVWAAAELYSHDRLESGLTGVAVTYDKTRGRFSVVTVDDSPESDFAVPCPGSGTGMGTTPP